MSKQPRKGNPDLVGILSETVRRIQDQTHLFIIVGVTLLTISFLALLAWQPTDVWPFYVLAVVAGLLIAAGIARRAKSPSLDDSIGRRTMKEKYPADRRGLERILTEALLTLHALDEKAAAIPKSERSVSLTRDLEEQRMLVADLEERLKALSERE